MSSIGENVDDRLSMLPEEILSRILSLMPTIFAVRTSILSRRWRYTWTLVTNLEFDDDTDSQPFNDNIFIEFVDRVLKFYKTSHVKLFRLHVSSYQVPWSSISKWIDNAVRLNVRELDICVIQHELPLSVFTCKTLTNLRFDFSSCDNVDLEFPSQIHLPCLKILDIVEYNNSLVDALKLICGCPVLESLSLEVSCNDEQDCTFNISTLKRLKLIYNSATTIYTNKIVLRVPQLEYLYVGGVLGSFFVMEDVSSLVGASIACWSSTYNYMWADLLNQITGVQTLSIENFPLTSPLPIFPNMKQLELKGVWKSGQITQFLESCPELKILCIDFVDWRDFKPEESKLIPTCMLTNLTTIKFSKCDGGTSDIRFLKYMLGNAHVLKAVTIFAQEHLLVQEDPWLCAQVLKFSRASPHCQIHFRPWKLPPSQESDDSDEVLY